MIAVIDYGAGNLRSVANALDHLELPWRLAESADRLAGCTRILLPGVGHFGSAMQRLVQQGLASALCEAVISGTPLLGICLGMQLLFEASAEADGVAGLGLLAGRVERLETATIPHMGWNRVLPASGAALFAPTGCAEYFYFAHSYVCRPSNAEHVAATTECEGRTFCVAVRAGGVYGVQFHPEKSAVAGLEVLRRFARC